jgi:hypothetical protein
VSIFTTLQQLLSSSLSIVLSYCSILVVAITSV